MPVLRTHVMKVRSTGRQGSERNEIFRKGADYVAIHKIEF